jgi:hypothetical protein
MSRGIGTPLLVDAPSLACAEQNLQGIPVAALFR